MIRRLLVLVLCFLTAVQPAAFAYSEVAEMRAPVAQDTIVYLHSVDALMTRSNAAALPTAFDPKEVRRRIAEGTIAAIKKPATALPHMAQTLTLLWILGGIEAARQNHAMKAIQNKRLPMSEMLLHVGDHLINSFDLISSMSTASATSGILAKPVGALNQLITSNVTRPMLQKLLVSGAGSFVTFVGWEAGAKLWEDATLLLPAEDIGIAKKLRFIEIMSGGGTEEQRRVFTALLGNAFGILTWADPEVSKFWIYNTWRHRIATGQFVTMLTSMVVAGTVAGSLAPGAGNFVGFCFGVVGGLVGGVIAIFLPRSVKQPITDGLRRMRIDDAQGRLVSYRIRLERALRRPYASLAYQEAITAQFLKARTNARNDMLTVYFEQIYDAYLRLQEADTVLKIIRGNPGQPIAIGTLTDDFLTSQQPVKAEPAEIEKLKEQFTEQGREAAERVTFYFNQLLEVQKSEVKYLGPLAYDERWPEAVRAKFNAAIADQTTVHMALRYVFLGLMPSLKQELGLEGISDEDLKKLPVSSLVMLNLFYLRAFQESSFLDP